MDVMVKNELRKGLESVNQLRVLFDESKTTPQLNKELLMATMNQHCCIILDTFETTISILKDAHLQVSHTQNRRDTHNQPVKVVRNTTTLEDGYCWRKYGQKPIANTKYPREYYRCGHYGQGCPARKYVQMVSDVPTQYGIIYYSHHTCQNISIINSYTSQVDFDENEYQNMLCFGSSNVPKIVEQVSNQMKRGKQVIKEDTCPLPYVQNAPSSSSSSYDHSLSISLDQWAQDQVIEEQCYSMDSLLIDEELKYLISDGADFVGDLDEVMGFRI